MLSRQNTIRPDRFAALPTARSQLSMVRAIRAKGIALDFTSAGLRIRFPTNEILPRTVHVNAGAVNIRGPARVIWQEGSEGGFELIWAPATPIS